MRTALLRRYTYLDSKLSSLSPALSSSPALSIPHPPPPPQLSPRLQQRNGFHTASNQLSQLPPPLHHPREQRTLACIKSAATTTTAGRLETDATVDALLVDAFCPEMVCSLLPLGESDARAWPRPADLCTTTTCLSLPNYEL